MRQEPCIPTQTPHPAVSSTSRTLKNRLLKYLFSDFDKINDTNYTSTVLKEIDKEKIENRINFFTSDDILADIDF